MAQVAEEPITRQCRHLLQGARFFEEMSGTGNHHKLTRRRDRRLRLPVQLQDGLVTTTDDQQRGSVHFAQRIAREIGPPAAGHHRLHLDAGVRGRDQSRAGASAGPEESHRQRRGVRLCRQPPGDVDQSPGE